MGQVEVFSKIPTCENLKGIHTVSTGKDFCVATCHEQIGCVNLTWFMKKDDVQATQMKGSSDKNTMEAVDTKILETQKLQIEAHQNAVTCMTVNNKGTLLATASQQVRGLVRANSLLSGNIGQNIQPHDRGQVR